LKDRGTAVFLWINCCPRAAYPDALFQEGRLGSSPPGRL
jgi:hypothetical protein